MFKIQKMIKQLYILLVLLCLLTLGIYILFIKPQQTLSEVEKRVLANNQDLEDLSIIDNDYRSNIESILADQFLDRLGMVELKSKIDYYSSKVVFNFVDNPFLLKKMGDTEVYQIGNYPYLTSYPLMYSEEYENRILNRIDQINTLSRDFPNIKMYVYKPTQLSETSLLDEYNNIESSGEYYNFLLESNFEVPYRYLHINSFEDYLNYLYYSDHHWSHKGIYQGYIDIVDMIFGNTDDIMVPWDENCFNGMRFYGTTSTITGNVFEGAPFCVYGYTMPDYTLYYEDTEIPTHLDSNNYYFYPYDNNKLAYHYYYAYNLIDAPVTLLELTTKEQDQPSILIIGDSYGPAVLPLLAHHFNNIYFVNPFNYESKYHEKFNYDEFLKTHQIDNLLFMYIIDNYVVSDDYGDRYKSFDVVRD